MLISGIFNILFYRFTHMASRPIILTIVSLLMALIGLIGLITGVIDLLDTVNYDVVVGVIISLVEIVVGLGLLKGDKPFWYLAVVITAVYALYEIYLMATGGSYSGIVVVIVALIILWYMFTSKVKKFFGI